jgi:hypothetical protein
MIRFIIIAFFYLHAGILLAQSNKIGVQGTLRKSDGNSLEDGEYTMTFRLYNAATGGTVLWSEVQTQVEIAGGLYSTQLGNVNSLALPFDADYYLSVQVEDTPEITPRQQLTSAPYALAFKGSGNIFPSSGAIGIGTTSPSPSSNLHITSNSGAVNQLIEGSSGAKIDLKKGTTTASIGHHPSLSQLEIKNSDNTAFQVNGTDRLLVTNNGISVTGTGTFTQGIYVPSGAVALGNISIVNSTLNHSNDWYIIRSGTGGPKLSLLQNELRLDGHLQLVSGSQKSYSSPYAWYNNTGDDGCVPNSVPHDYSISCAGRIRAPKFHAYSDMRIKKNITTSNATTDLEILRRMRVCDYRHIDFVANGTEYKKGFIAQEVKEIYSECVAETTGFLPDIFQIADRVQQSGNQLLISLLSNHGLQAGEKVRLVINGQQKDYLVAATTDEKTFMISDWHEDAPQEVFVYGRQVNDFLQVDYDRIHTLNVSVTQELLRRKDAMERERAALRLENDVLKTSLGNIDVRLRNIEAKLSH